jgi:hypothetical protein
MKIKSLRRYFRTNPGSLLILTFQVLLVIATILLTIGNSGAANQIALYAFLAVVVGIAIQFVLLSWADKKGNRANNVSDPSPP